MDQLSTGKVILKTALITSAIMLAACVLGAVIVFFCFPYEGYKFFDGMGMQKTTLFFAEQYAGDDNMDGVVYCVDLTDSLYDETHDNKYAAKLMAYTEKFYEFESASSYIDKLDEYYINNSARQARVGLFSYDEHLISRNYKARAALGKTEDIIFRGKPTPIEEVLSSELSNLEKACVYSAITEQLKLGLNPLTNENGAPTDLNKLLSATMPKYLVTIRDASDKLEELFLMRKAIELLLSVTDVLSGPQLEEWQFYLTEYDDRPLTAVYADLLYSYINE